MEKTCKKCNKTYDIGCFTRDKKMKDGYKNECHYCRQIRENLAYRKFKNIAEEKFCPVCEKTRSSLDFNLENYNKDGLASICKECAADKELVVQSRERILHTCSKCKIEKNGIEFPVMRQNYTCLYPVCKDCLSIYRHQNGIYTKMANKLKEKKQKDLEYAEYFKNRANLRHFKEPRNRMLWQAKKRAREKGLDFSITKVNITIPELCPILNIPFVFGRKGDYEFSPSLDRINNNYGYIPGNIQVVTKKANSMKNSATPEELLLLADWVYETFGHLTDNLKTA